MEITRSGILRDCLEEANREMHKYSRHNAGLLPLEGYENHFADLSAKCAMLRAMILETESREAETKNDTDPRTSKPLAQWQKDLMDQEAPGLPLNGHGDWSMAAIAAGTAPYPADKKWNPETQEWEPMMTPDESILRRRYQKAWGFKPEPVIKTDESGVYVNGEKVLPKPVVYPGGEE